MQGSPRADRILGGKRFQCSRLVRDSYPLVASSKESSQFQATRAQGMQRLNFECVRARLRISGNLDNTGGGRIL